MWSIFWLAEPPLSSSVTFSCVMLHGTAARQTLNCPIQLSWNIHTEIQTPGDFIFEEVDEFPAAERLLPQMRRGSNADWMAVCKSTLILS